MINRKGVISIDDTELSKLIRQCAVYDKGETGQRRDQSYKFALRWKMKLNCHDLFYRVPVYDEAREDNDVIDRTSVVYFEIETVLSWPIGKDAVYHEK